MKKFSELSEQEILALAISLEEEHGRIYADYADGLKETFPASAKVFTDMAEEENEHRRWLIDLHREKFGEHIPLLRRSDVKGFLQHEPIWRVRPLGLDKVRIHADSIGSLLAHTTAADPSLIVNLFIDGGDFTHPVVQNYS